MKVILAAQTAHLEWHCICVNAGIRVRTTYIFGFLQVLKMKKFEKFETIYAIYTEINISEYL